MSKNSDNAYVEKNDKGLLRLTDAGRTAIDSWVTSTEGNVYAFTPDADPLMVSAAMARLSRNSNGLLTIVADEFLDKEKRDSQLLHRVVTEYGDDSVLQLYPVQLVLEGISNIATKEVEWGRLAGYLEQSTRYLRFDTKNEAGHYAYYSPTELDEKTFAEYETALNEIFDIYSELYQKLSAHIMETSKVPEAERDGAWKRAVHAQACDGIRSLLPAATTATVGVSANAHSINNMILHMLGHQLPEMNRIGVQLLEAVRGIAPVFFERTDMPNRGGLISASQTNVRTNARALAAKLIGDEDIKEVTPSAEIVAVRGTEDDLIVKILADHSSESYAALTKLVAGFSDAEKKDVIETYVGDRYNRRVKPGRAFEMVDYVIEGHVDYGAFRDIQRHRMVDGLDWQPLKTGLGHVRPAIIDEAGLTEQYEKAFATSAKMYDTLVARGYEDQAQYATLFGHIMRFTMKVNARSLVHTIELRTTPQGHPAYRKFYQDIHEQITKVHPLVAESMIFVSKSEDEELARLGAERLNEAKRQALDQQK